MTTPQQVFELTIHLIDEATGAAVDTADTREYKNRTLAILNILRVECSPACQSCDSIQGRPLCPMLTDFEQSIGLDDAICQGVLPYGLAAHLLLEENPAAASFFQQRYEQALQQVGRTLSAATQPIENVYGGIEYSQFGRW